MAATISTMISDEVQSILHNASNGILLQPEAATDHIGARTDGSREIGDFIFGIRVKPGYPDIHVGILSV